MDYRNILLDDKPMDWRIRIEPKRREPKVFQYTAAQQNVLTQVGQMSIGKGITVAEFPKYISVIDFAKVNKNTTKRGATLWTNKEVQYLLASLGLPEDSPLSVIVVEVLPHITNVAEHISTLGKPRIAAAASNLVEDFEKNKFISFAKKMGGNVDNRPGISPVDEDLGNKRIYRTSRLTPIPEICCTDCD